MRTLAKTGDPGDSASPCAMAAIEDLQLLTVILTAQCNLRCRYCFQDAKRARSLSWDNLRAALDLVVGSRQPVVHVLFTGGEPLLEFAKLRRAVAYLRQHCGEHRRFIFGLNTNGVLLTEEIVEFLARHRFHLQLSFDGVARAQDFRGRGTFAVLDRLLARLRGTRPDFYRTYVAVGVTTTPTTLGHLAASTRYLLGEELRNVAINPSITADPTWSPERIEDLDAQFALMYADCVRHFETTGEIPLQVFKRRAGNAPLPTRDRAMCGMASAGALAVDVDGQGIGCSTFAGSVRGVAAPMLTERKDTLRMGRVDDPDFGERYARFPEIIRRTEFFHHKARKYSTYGRCTDCECLSECSVCPGSILQIPGNADPHRVADFCCAYQQVSARYRARFPA